MEKKLTKKEEVFVEAIANPAVSSNTQAALLAGYSENTACAIANENLNKPYIQTAIEKRKAEYRALADVEAKDIIGAQQEIAFASIEDALDDDGYINFPKAKQNGAAKLIKKISRTPNKYGEAVTVEFYSRSDALNQLADILGIKQMPKENENSHWVRAAQTLISKGSAKDIQEAIQLLKEAEFQITPEIETALISEANQ